MIGLTKTMDYHGRTTKRNIGIVVSPEHIMWMEPFEILDRDARNHGLEPTDTRGTALHMQDGTVLRVKEDIHSVCKTITRWENRPVPMRLESGACEEPDGDPAKQEYREWAKAIHIAVDGMKHKPAHPPMSIKERR